MTEAVFISDGVVMLRSNETLLSLVVVCCFSASAFAQSQETVSGSAELQDGEEIEEIIVRTTRSGRRVQDEPIRVDVLNQEEIEEKVMMRPGNIVMMLAETGGLRVQTTSPALGAANIRVQGLSGRYTQLLTDGLPLYGGQAISLL